MNCKPGDVAVSVHPTKYTGWVFSVVRVAPRQVFQLPDGVWAEGCPANSWVLESLSGPLFSKKTNGDYGSKLYGTGDDKWLRPLTDPDADIARTTEREVAA